MSIPAPCLRLTGAQFSALSKDGAYAWKRGEEFLYIGSSTRPLKRIGGHNVIGVAEPVLDTDEILVWPTDDMLAFEAALAGEVRPKYSARLLRGKPTRIACLTCRKKFMQKRWWQKYCSDKCRSTSL